MVLGISCRRLRFFGDHNIQHRSRRSIGSAQHVERKADVVGGKISRADTIRLVRAVKGRIASRATTRKRAARTGFTQLPSHLPAKRAAELPWPEARLTDAPGMRCRLSPTADVPSHTSGAV